MANFAKLQSLFEQACELPRAEQEAFVDAACADDAELHAELTALLASDEQVKDHTARKAVGDIAALLNEGRPDALVGAQVGRYTLVSLIGAGGMGSVYLAERHDGVVQQRVAIKFLGRDLLGDGFRQRFEIEREILAKLDHPSITRLIDAEQLPDGTPYYVMDYVEGQPITRYAFDNQLDVNARLDLFVEVAKAVSHAHQALIVHRDIKPGNILVDTQGAPHLLDFGIAKPLAQLGAQTVSMTVTGQRFFSPQHAAPEQLLGGNITVGCDVYGLGCLLYELLSGEPAIPLTGLTASEAEKQILHQLPQAPSQRVVQGEKNDERASGFGASNVKAWSKSIKGELDSIVLTCLRKLPHERYRSVDDLIADVQAYRAGMPISASGGHGWYRTKKFIARHRWAVTAATLTAIALISSSVVTALQSREAKTQRDAAQTALAQAEQQRDRAQHVTQFLIDAFAAANPGGELGKSVTAREILEHGAKKLETELEGQPGLRAALFATISEAQSALSITEGALRTATLAVEALPSDGSADCFAPFAALVRVLTATREISQAEAAVPQMAECVVNPRQRLISANLQSSLMSRAGKAVERLELVKEELAHLRQFESELPRAEWLDLQLALASAQSELGNYEEGLRISGEVLESIRRKPTADRRSLIEALQGMAIVNKRLERWDDAQAYAVEAVTVAEDIFGRTSHYFLKTKMTLANIYADSKKGDFVVDFYEELLGDAERVLGSGTQSLTFKYNYATVLWENARKTQAVRVLGEVVSTAEKTFEKESRALFRYRAVLAKYQHELGECNRAASLAEIAIEDYSVDEHAERYAIFTDLRNKLKTNGFVCPLGEG